MSTTIEHKGYTIYKQSQGGFYICGIKVVVPSEHEARQYVDKYLESNDKARQAARLKQARASISH